MEVTFAVTDRIATFVATVLEGATFLDLKMEVAKSFKKNYLKLFLNGVEIDFDQSIKDYSDKDNLFIFTNSSTSPSSDFIQQLKACKNYKRFVPNETASNQQILPNPMFPFFDPAGYSLFFDQLFQNRFIQQSSKNQQKFVFTNATFGKFFTEIDIQLQLDWPLDQCQRYIFDELKAKVDQDMTDMDLLIYTAGGIPFIGGTLANIYEQFPMDHLLFGVFYRKNDQTKLDAPIQEVCDISDDHHKFLISPACEYSTKRGLSDMACILGYFRHDGIENDLLLRATSSAISFPPFITSLYKIIDTSFTVTERDIITVCSVFYNYFRSILPEYIADDRVLEYGPRLCNIICCIDRIPSFLPIHVINNEDGQKTNEIAALKLPSQFPVLEDSFLAYQHYDLTIKDEEIEKDAYEKFTSFSPIYPKSISLIHSCRIIKGKNYEYLCLKPSANKKELVQIIDPTKGITFETTIDDFSVQQEMPNSIDHFEKLIDKEEIKQIIEICLDTSSAMKCDMNSADSNMHVDKMTISNQFISLITEHLYSHRIPCLQGLVSFGNDTLSRYPISPLDAEVDAKELEGIAADGQNYLWDAVLTSIYHITKCMNGPNGSEYKNARPRIIVISSGENCGSHAKIEDIGKVLIENHILLDAIVLGNKNECKYLCSMCHMTGGSLFLLQTIEDGIELFEKGAFFDIEKRKLFNKPLIGNDRKFSVSRIKPDMVDFDFIQKISENANIDTEIIDSDLVNAKSNRQITTPRLVIDSNHDKIYMKMHHRRLLKELQLAAEMMEPNQNEPDRKIKYDPNIKVFITKGDMTTWRIYLKGPDNSPYENKWWYLIATFPETYPINPPTFRFITVPYHINVSTDGMICLDWTDSKYKSEIHVIDMIKGIRNLLSHPNIELPIRIVSLNDFKDNYQEYERNAKESAEMYAKNDYTEYLTNIYINDSVSDDFVLQFTKQLSRPLYYC